MSYLERLRNEFSEKGLPRPLTKATEAPSVSFGSATSRRIPEFEAKPDASADAAPAVPLPASGAECMKCANLVMLVEHLEGTRRVFWWRCRKGYALMEGRNYGERVMLAPAECDDFEQWQAGQR